MATKRLQGLRYQEMCFGDAGGQIIIRQNNRYKSKRQDQEIASSDYTTFKAVGSVCSSLCMTCDLWDDWEPWREFRVHDGLPTGGYIQILTNINGQLKLIFNTG